MFRIGFVSGVFVLVGTEGSAVAQVSNGYFGPPATGTFAEKQSYQPAPPTYQPGPPVYQPGPQQAYQPAPQPYQSGPPLYQAGPQGYQPGMPPPYQQGLMPVGGQGPGGPATNVLLNEQPPPPPPPKIWSGGIEFGINGSTGNSELVNVRAGWNATRKTDDNILATDILYALAKEASKTTQNQMLFNARDEVLFAGSPWAVFGSTNVEYDQSKPYDVRVGLFAGVSYVVVSDEKTNFKVRGGFGVVREFGGSNDKWEPELDFGYDYNHKFTDRQSFISTLDYYPQIDNFGQYQVRARTAYEIVVDPDTGMALRLGAQLRYDSDPGNAKRADLTYYASILMKF
jgi:hypothetical protein